VLNLALNTAALLVLAIVAINVLCLLTMALYWVCELFGRWFNK